MTEGLLSACDGSTYTISTSTSNQKPILEVSGTAIGKEGNSRGTSLLLIMHQFLVTIYLTVMPGCSF